MRLRRRPRATIVGIISRGNKILLIKRANQPHKGWWALVGGKLERYETAENAMKREIKEELGVRVKKLKFIFYNDSIIKKLNRHALEICFKVETATSFKINKQEVSEFKYFTKNEIKKMKLAFTHKQILNKYFYYEK